MFDHVLCWIRRDLRLSDHVALAEATKQARAVTVVFVFDNTILSKLSDKDDKRISFIHDALEEVDRSLREHGSQLLVRQGDPKNEIPKVAKELGVQAVFTNRDYEPSAKVRDAAVKVKLEAQGLRFFTFKDHVIFEGLEVKTGAGDPYRVFTPYKFTWLSQLKKTDYQEHRPNFKALTPKNKLQKFHSNWPMESTGFKKVALWLEAGESAAQGRLKKFRHHVDDYHASRDIPAKTDGTSGLSVHLRFGTISIRALVRFAIGHASRGAHIWLSELIWRDFYQMILDQYPHVVHAAFKKECDAIKWPGREEHFEKWKEGQTGFPLVDAAMRHFKETGWMHNRLRMVVASFLTKDLLVDWKKGEGWFARKLLDFDLAANNGGWQWSASTGCDAQPYFRIFNPVSQSKKFDPEGQFIRKHVPELKNISDDEIHWPHETGLFSSVSGRYASPLVDHRDQRIKALALFKRI